MNKSKLISQLKACNALQYGKFVLTSGAISDYYIDIKNASTHPPTLRLIAQSIAQYTQHYDILAGMELGAVPLIVAVSLETNQGYAIIRKHKRIHGTTKPIEGEPVKNKKTLLIEDVTTSGGSVLQAIKILREHEAIVDQVITVVDRESGAREKIEKLNIKFTPLLSVHEILDK